MGNQLLQTPEGVRDIYGEECARKLAVQEQIQKVFHLYGYRDIETPVFEFFDIFNKERGSVGDREMYKFFDRDNNTLVLRPDITPSIARCAAKYFMDEAKSLRFCYLGQTFINSTSYQGRFKETTQTGAELIGDDTSDADGEMIAMVIDALKAAGLKEFQVELGQVEFYRGLVEEAGMDQETMERLHTRAAKSPSGSSPSYCLSRVSPRTRAIRTWPSPSSHRRKSGSRSSRWPLSRRRAAQKEWMVEIWAL